MTIDVEKVLALVREVADPRWADPVCSMGDMVTLTLDEMSAFADRVAARERAALAAEPAQPVAWYVERRAPGYGDDGVKSGPWWSKNEAKRFADDHHILRPLYPADPQPHADAIREAVEAEREACAKVCEELEQELYRTDDGSSYSGRYSDQAIGAEKCADAIRARGAA